MLPGETMKTPGLPMPRNARVDVCLYASMSRAEIREAARERVRHYSQPPPDPDLAGTWVLLRGAWEWAERKHRRAK